MKWLVLASVLAACDYFASDAAKTQTPDATVTPEQCEADFDMSFQRQCSVPSDCVLLAHSDCCHEIDIGVSQADLAAAMAAQMRFNACIGPACGGRGCGGVTTAEDGHAPAQGQTIVPTCVAGMCTSTVQ